ncbi:ABC transporter ATP-binding protein [Azorhizobium doebereinerae]|uniref:ABC transporter ATP-binding protein n=1 Tax=Azorhizobium doebereinerae TaxID=281091 RepID=UPI00041AB7DE|nr:ATP-binding cassette domain-containing protein [Azorhizobium doebereinerae]
MLAFERVSWSVGGQPVLGGVDLCIGRGELVVLIGASGVGKSSVLRLAAGLLEPTGGHVARRARRCAMVFQDPRLLPWESALDNVGLPLEAHGVVRADARVRAGRWLARLGFRAEDLAKRPGQLSGGMKARVAVARAFVVEPDLVLLDEPFAALDLGLRRDMQALTRSLVVETGVAALFVTHDLTEAVRLADRILVLAGRPARITAAIGQRPVAAWADIWQAAAAFARRPDIAPVLAGLTELSPHAG